MVPAGPRGATAGSLSRAAPAGSTQIPRTARPGGTGPANRQRARRRIRIDDADPTEAAARRHFRSKVDSIRPTYGFEDVSLAPGTETVEPADVSLEQDFAGIPLRIPVLAAAMDAVVDARSAGALAGLGGLAVLNLEGVQARYDDPAPVLERIATAPDAEVQAVLAEAYAAPIREELIARRIAEIHAAGSKAAVSATPGVARRFGPFCAEHGADLFLVQSQVEQRPPPRDPATSRSRLAEFTGLMPIPVAVGNTTNAEAAFALMEQGAAAVFVGVGPGAACTTREVLGIGVPQVTAVERRGRRARRVLRRDRPLGPGRGRRRDEEGRRHRQGDRGRRRRGHARQPARARRRRRPGAARTGAWPRRRRSCRAARGSGSARSGRWSRSSSGRRT